MSKLKWWAKWALTLMVVLLALAWPEPDLGSGICHTVSVNWPHPTACDAPKKEPIWVLWLMR
jgi:hypothetical protein